MLLIRVKPRRLELQSPYQVALIRMQMGLACRSLGDEDTAAWELEAARGVFAQLGGTPDVTRVDSLARLGEPDNPLA